MENNIQKLFAEYINYCEYIKRLRPETVRGYEEVFRYFTEIMPELINSQDVTCEMMIQFFKRIQVRERILCNGAKRVGLKNSTIKTYGSKLNAFFVWMLTRGIIKTNPISDLKLPEPIYSDSRALDKQSVDKIITAVNLYSIKSSLVLRRDTLMIYLLLYLGVRAGEFISIKVKDIDFVNKTIIIRGETSKSKRDKTLPIHSTLMFHLSEYIKERNILCYKTEFLIVSSTNDRGLSRHGLKHWVKRLVKLSGVNFHLHRFRHTFAVNLAEKDVGLVKIQKLMGHKDIKMTMTYLRSISAKDLGEDIAKLSF